MQLIWLSGPIASMRKDFSRSSYVASFSRLQVISHGLVCDPRKVSDIRDTTELSKLGKGMPLCRLACQPGRWVLIRIRKGRPRVIIRSELRIHLEWTHYKQCVMSLAARSRMMARRSCSSFCMLHWRYHTIKGFNGTAHCGKTYCS